MVPVVSASSAWQPLLNWNSVSEDRRGKILDLHRLHYGSWLSCPSAERSVCICYYELRPVCLGRGIFSTYPITVWCKVIGEGSVQGPGWNTLGCFSVFLVLFPVKGSGSHRWGLFLLSRAQKTSSRTMASLATDSQWPHRGLLVFWSLGSVAPT